MLNVEVKNPLPTYITATDAVTQETADSLIRLVDERGKHSEWSYNPFCTELQIANPFSRTQTPNDEEIIKVLPELFGLSEGFLRYVNWNLKNTACEVATGHHGFWVLKYGEGGSFESHCDWDSGPNGIRPPIVATAAVMLNDDFEGGETVLFDSTGEEAIIEGGREKLSAIVWDGFTQHEVKPVTRGTRYALVIHYTGTVK